MINIDSLEATIPVWVTLGSGHANKIGSIAVAVGQPVEARQALADLFRAAADELENPSEQNQENAS